MADPLSITASIASITVPALHCLRLFLDDLQKIKDTPEVIADLKNSIHSINLSLISLQSVPENEWEVLGRTVVDGVAAMISTQTKACDILRMDLLRWTSHSQCGKLTLKNRVKVGFLKQDRVKSMSQQLQNCKLSISSVVNIATLHSYIRHARISEDIKKTISTRRAEISTGIRSTDEQIAEVERGIEEFSVASDIQRDSEAMEDQADAIRQIEEEQKALRASRKILDELFEKMQDEKIEKAAAESQSGSTSVTFGNQNSGFQIGVSNGSISGISFGAR